MATPKNFEYLFPSIDLELRAALLGTVHPDTKPKLVTPAELELREPPIWYLEHFVPEEGLAILYGPPKTGKTFLSMEWAFRLAYGVDWEGYHVDRAIRVLYLAAEGLGSLGERQKALRSARAWDPPENLRWMTGSRHLYAKNGPTVALQELYASVDEFQPQVIFVDTLARHSPGGNVSDNHDMQMVINRLDMMRMAWGCSFVLVHHTRRGDNEFIGAQALFGSTDVMIELRTNGRLFSLRAESRDWEAHRTPFDLQITSVKEDSPGWAVVENAGSRRAVEGGRYEDVEKWRIDNPEGTKAECQFALWDKEGTNVYQYWIDEEEKL